MTIEHLLGEIASNNRSGAAEILERAVELFEVLALQAFDTATILQARNITSGACAGLVKAQPCMAPLMNMASAVIRAANTATSAPEVLKSTTGAAREFRRCSSRAALEAATNAARLIHEGARVLTHSRSSTILRALIAANKAGTRFSVVATESRPLLEGRTLAEALTGQGVEVTLIADTAAALALENVSFVLVGADRVTPLAVENKIGTRMIALAAREQRVPVYAVADSSKFINPPDRRAFADEERSADELWPNAPDRILVLNRYFEETSLRHFSGIITEDGVLAPEEASRRAEAASIEPALIAALNDSNEDTH